MIDIDAIEKRAKEATEGPWKWERNGKAWDLEGRYRAVVLADTAWDIRRADAEFIAHAREDVPALVAEVRRLQSALINCAVPLEVLDAESNPHLSPSMRSEIHFATLGIRAALFESKAE